MSLLRKIVYFLFTIIFLICAPMIVMYSLGYLFKSGDVPTLVKTGLIYIDAFPKDASVSLKNSTGNFKMPATIRDLSPGDYEIRVEAVGYEPWTKQVHVSSGKATVYDKLFLKPINSRGIELGSTPMRDFIPGGNGQYFIASSGRSMSDYFLYDIKADSWIPFVAGPDNRLSKLKVFHIHRVMNSDIFVIETEERNSQRFFAAHMKDMKALKEITSLFFGIPSRIAWDPAEESVLFAYFEDRHLSRMDIKSMTVVPQFKTAVDGFGFFREHLYMLKDSKMIKSDLEGKSLQILADDQALLSSLFDPGAFVRISILKKDLILFVQPNGRLVSNRIPYRFVEEGVKGFQAHPRKKRVLIWTAQKIGILDFIKPDATEIFERVPEVRWIYDQGKEISQAFWIYQGSHVLFKDGTRILMLQLFDQDMIIQEIAQTEKMASIEYSEEFGVLFFLDERTGRPRKTEIIPKSELGFITLPEFESKNAPEQSEES